MKMLVLYSNTDTQLRNTILDHLYCFRNYLDDVEFHYCNVLLNIPYYLSFVKYDGIILHYTLLSAKWTQIVWKDVFRGLRALGKMKSAKVAIPQDEYVYSDELCRLFREYGIETVYTCAYPVDYEVLYPKKKTGLKHYFTTYTGFVNEHTLEKMKRLSDEVEVRDIDIGYRARKLPYWLGHFGQLKYQLGQLFQPYKKKADLKVDISTDPEDVFFGDDWYRFLLRCRTLLGCLGGASMHAPEGIIREKVEAYMKKYPESTFDEVERCCFQGKDSSLRLFALSPRHFEYAMAKTCQVLVEGDYDGVLQPGVHFIVIKRDFSNLDEVIEKIKDKKLCEQISERAYQDIVASNKYTYRHFAEEVIRHIRNLSHSSGRKTNGKVNQLCFQLVGYFLRARKRLENLHRLSYRFYLFRKIRLPRLPNYLKRRVKKLKSIF